MGLSYHQQFVLWALFRYSQTYESQNRVDNLSHFIDSGFGLLLLSYRGYAGNMGSPSEEGFYKDARAALSVRRSSPELSMGLQPERMLL